MSNKLKINFIEFILKNFFWYTVMVACNQSFNPTEWWIYQFFWGGVLFTIIEFFILTTCLIENNKEENGN